MVTSGNKLYLKFFPTYSFPITEKQNKFKSNYGLDRRSLNGTIWRGKRNHKKLSNQIISFPQDVPLVCSRASANLLEQGSFNYTTSF